MPQKGQATIAPTIVPFGLCFQPVTIPKPLFVETLVFFSFLNLCSNLDQDYCVTMGTVIFYLTYFRPILCMSVNAESCRRSKDAFVARLLIRSLHCFPHQPPPPPPPISPTPYLQRLLNFARWLASSPF